MRRLADTFLKLQHAYLFFLLSVVLMYNPFELVTKVDVRGKESFHRRALNEDEARRLLAGPHRPLYLLALHTGLRRGEINALRWGDLHLDLPRCCQPCCEAGANHAANRKKLASMVALLACRGGVRTLVAACGWRTSLACLLGALAAVPGCNNDAGASPDCFLCCVSSLAISISGWPRILPVRLESSFLRWRCAVRVSGMENLLAGKLRGHDARHFAGFLAGWFAPIARPSRGTPRSFQRAIGEP
jgi:hypothetical protein